VSALKTEGKTNMSAERNYRCHVKDYYQGTNDKGEVDLAKLAAQLKVPTGDDVIKLGEARVRSFISSKLGAIEEAKHGTQQDPDSKKRFNQVPETVTAYHNRLVDELYHFIAPSEAPID
jgi:hypothetical protein